VAEARNRGDIGEAEKRADTATRKAAIEADVTQKNNMRNQARHSVAAVSPHRLLCHPPSTLYLHRHCSASHATGRHRAASSSVTLSLHLAMPFAPTGHVLRLMVRRLVHIMHASRPHSRILVVC